jgi:hypothetical protein
MVVNMDRSESFSDALKCSIVDSQCLVISGCITTSLPYLEGQSQ